MDDPSLRQQNALLNETEQKQGAIVLASKPRIASLGLTLRCNLNCVMCFTQKMAKKDMDDDVFKNVVQLFPYLEEVRWNDAGEFFASRKCATFLETINRVKVPKSYISTNFKAAGEYMDELLGGGFTHISVSIDAATAETYHSIRRGGDFQVLCRDLERFHELKVQRGLDTPRLTLVFIAMRRNIHELPQFVELARRCGAVEIHVLKLLANPAELEKTESVTLEELRPFYQRAYDKANEYGIRLSHIAYTDQELQVEHSPKSNAVMSETQSDPALSDRQSYFQFKGRPFCLSPWTEILIDVHGKVRPCCYHPRVLGDLHRDSVLDIWNNDQYQTFRAYIRDHDFRECHHCSWLHKVFHYQVPNWSTSHFALNKRLESLERGYDLEQDLVIRHNPFIDLKIELDPMAFRLNKEWDLNTVLPDTHELIVPRERQDRDQELFKREREHWEHDLPERDSIRGPSRALGLARLLKKALVRLLRFHTGQRFLHQRETNLIILNHIQELSTRQQLQADYISRLKTFFDNQKNFNALLVQYINQFSDRFFDRIQRQKEVNTEILHLFRQTNERIDHLERDNQLLLELINRLEQRPSDPKHPSPLQPHSLNDFFLSGHLTLTDMPPTVCPGSKLKVQARIHNRSLRTWSDTGPTRVGLTWRWFTPTGTEWAHHDRALHWLNTIVPENDTTTVALEITSPDQPGPYRLNVSLVTDDGRLFADFNTGFCEYDLEVIRD
ncbi:SPASM domain-containing protein [bacterium]|nr:SPASM domain-containing protein [bacterium]